MRLGALAAATFQPNASYPTLQKGARGADVVTLQKKLVAAGIPVGASGADGVYGNDTFSAVKAYQQSRDLVLVDGIAGPQTWAALDQNAPQIKPIAVSDSSGTTAANLQTSPFTPLTVPNPTTVAYATGNPSITVPNQFIPEVITKNWPKLALGGAAILAGIIVMGSPTPRSNSAMSGYRRRSRR